jgi:hypothetical protein
MGITPFSLNQYIRKAADGDDGEVMNFVLKLIFANLGYTDLTIPISSADPTMKVSPAADQDPIFDTANGVKLSITTTQDIFTPGAGHKYARITTDTDIFITTDGVTAAADDAKAVRILANSPEIVPVTPGAVIKAISSSGTAVVRVMPLKVRP